MKIVAMSDTHGKHRLVTDVPDGDVLVHAGDFTKHGKLSEVKDFADWFSQFPHEHKVVVAGNHDFVMEGDGKRKEKACRIFFKNDIVYLEDAATVCDGVTFYGSPFSNTFDRYAFNEDLPEIMDEVDVLITHGPPKGVLDYLGEDEWGHIGSEQIKERKKGHVFKAHIFGHVHSQYGREVNYYNVSILDEDYQVSEKPAVIEVSHE